MPSCHACSVEATTRCPRCGVPSCVAHLAPAFGPYGAGVRNEYVCEACRSVIRGGLRAVVRLGVIFLPILFILFAVMMIGMRTQ